MKQCALFVVLLAVLAGSLSCGFIRGSAPDGPERLAPDGALELVLTDVEGAALTRTDLPAALESQVSNLETFGDVRQQANLSLPTGQLAIAMGEFDFEDIRNNLRERSYIAATYREFSFWESPDGTQGSALLEDEGYLISGDFAAVVDVLRDKNRDSGLLWNDDEGELNRAMEASGEGLVATAGRDCQLANNVGCRAVAWAFSRGEERRTVVVGVATLLFRDGTSAAGAIAGIEQSIGNNQIMTLTKILREDAIITLTVDIDREAFPALELPVDLGR